MKRILIILIIVAIAVGGGFLFMRSRGANDKQVFRTKPVSKGTIQSVVTATGELTAVTAVDVGSEVSGVIDKIYVEHNSKVKKVQYRMASGKCIVYFFIPHSRFLHPIPDYKYISIQYCLRLLLYNWNIHNLETIRLHCTSIRNSAHSQIHKAD